MGNSGYRKASIETLKSARDVAGTIRPGTIASVPTAGKMFYMYRPSGHYMRTNVVLQVTSQAGDGDSVVYEFETESGSKYRLTLTEELDSAQLPS